MFVRLTGKILFAALCAFASITISSVAFSSTIDPTMQTEYGFIDTVREDEGLRYWLPINRRAYLRDRPLVLILHGNGYSVNGKWGTKHNNNYVALAEHLAANGFNVFRPDWTGYNSDPEYGKRAIVDNLSKIYQEFGGRVSNQVVLIGHSVGGSAVVRYASEVEKLYDDEGKRLQLKSVISLGASVKYFDMDWENDLYETDSVLFIDASLDEDSSANKAHSGTDINRTALKLYDDAGSEAQLPSSHAGFEKDFMVVGGFKHGDLTGDGNKLIKAYINAYLRLHVYGESKFRPYFEGRVRPSSIGASPRVDQSHAYPEKKVIASFQRNSSRYFYGDSLGQPEGRIYMRSNDSYIKYNVTDSWKDPHSQHNTKVMNIEWDRRRGTPKIGFRYYGRSGVDVSEYEYLVFRAAQYSNGYDVNNKKPVYNEWNPTGEPVDLSIRVITANGKSKKIKLGKYDQQIKYPMLGRWYGAAGEGDASRNFMHSVRIPLTAFKKSGGSMVDLTAVKKVEFFFDGKGRITMDSLEFVKDPEVSIPRR